MRKQVFPHDVGVLIGLNGREKEYGLSLSPLLVREYYLKGVSDRFSLFDCQFWMKREDERKEKNAGVCEEEASSKDHLAGQSGEGLKVCADEMKQKANECFKRAQYKECVDLYTQALGYSESAVLYANRALAFLRMESYGLAALDAKDAIALDPSYVKGYYRLGSAKAALGHHKDALKVFRKVLTLAPNDRDARARYKLCEKEVKQAAFQSAIAMEDQPPPSEMVKPEIFVVPDSYDGPRLDDSGEVTEEFISEAIEYMRNLKVVHKKYVTTILIQVKRILDKLPSLVECSIDASEPGDDKPFLTVCGDTHGQFFDLLNIFEINGGRPSPKRPYLFNGDFVDRGSWSFEVVFTLICYKCLYPDHLHMLRGNHETKNMNKIYGFEGEILSKYDSTVMDLFTEVFQWLPICATIEKKVVVMHGGLFSDENVKLDDIKRVNRVREPPESGIMSDILWSDPQPFFGRGMSKRGVGLSFGPDITKEFLKQNDLELLVRSHEVKDEGFLVEHDGRLITVFSAPNYCDQMQNKGALIRFHKDCVPEFKQFSAVSHPDIKPMAYAAKMNMFGL